MIFLVGQHCSGKTRISKVFSRAQFLCIDLGPLLREIHQGVSPHTSFADWIHVGEEIEGRHFTDSQLVEAISHQVSDGSGRCWQDLLIAGNRSLEGVQYLVERIGSYQGYRNVIVWVEAPVATLYRRYGVRNPDRPLSYADFLNLLEDDHRLGLPKLKDAAEFKLCNTCGEDALEDRVRELIRCLGYVYLLP